MSVYSDASDGAMSGFSKNLSQDIRLLSSFSSIYFRRLTNSSGRFGDSGMISGLSMMCLSAVYTSYSMLDTKNGNLPSKSIL